MLEQPNVGVVVSCTSRFYTTVKSCDVEELETASEEDDEQGGSKNLFLDTLDHRELLIVVFSPQFYTRFIFVYNVKSNQLRQIEGSPNEFIRPCLDGLSFARKQRMPFEKMLNKLISSKNFLVSNYALTMISIAKPRTCRSEASSELTIIVLPALFHGVFHRSHHGECRCI